MFTGIIEGMGKVTSLEKDGQNLHISMSCDFTDELKIDQSVSHNGVCLTVVNINGTEYTVTAIKETLDLTNLNSLSEGSLVNLERCMPAHGRFDGHIVQGHVDETAVCTSIVDEKGSYVFTFKCQTEKPLIVHKGSICINGISLTVTYTEGNEFSVAIIPYTLEHTNLQSVKEGDTVNIEFDIIGKYLAKFSS
jgi:riboflavin synthase